MFIRSLPRRPHANHAPITAPARASIRLAVLLACFAPFMPAHADDKAELEQLRATTSNLIRTLVDSGLLTREKAEELIRQARQPAAPASPAAPEPAVAEKKNVIRVPYVPETVKAEMREEIKKDVLAQARSERWGEPGALPAWLRRLIFDGDVRVRLQMEDWDKANFAVDDNFSYSTQTTSPAWSPDLLNTTHGRDRLTLRARLGVSSDLGFGFKAGLRLATGGTSPVSTSQTLGAGDGHQAKYNIYLDRGWLQWQAFDPDLTLVAGRFANPFFGGDLAWPDDLNFDGVAASYRLKWDDSNRLFAHAGAFPLQEFQTSASDKWLYGAQLGGEFKPSADSLLSLGLGYYQFDNIEGQFDDRYVTAVRVGSSYLSSEYPKSVRQKGNTLIRINPGFTTPANTTAVDPVWGLASKFKPLTFSAAYAYAGWDTLNIRGSFDLIKNTGFDLADIRRRANEPSLDIAKKTLAYQARIQIGSPKQELRGDWQAFATWRRFERDAWVDAFTDTTWHMGGTNYTGWSVGGLYYVGPRTSAGLRLTSTRNLRDGRVELITDNTGSYLVPNLSSADLKVDVIQLEVNARF